MVMSIGDALDENWNAVRDGNARVQQICAEIPLKVILETCLLSTEQKRRACEVCVEVGVAFVKTSTGFAGGGATAEDVTLMRETVGDEMGVKASGGIRDRESALAMLRAGANRLGCSAGVAIVTGGIGTGSY
ncbi:MAG: deoxyribose-phosphate aldolase, partial [Pseudomonadota bacterium]